MRSGRAQTDAGGQVETAQAVFLKAVTSSCPTEPESVRLVLSGSCFERSDWSGWQPMGRSAPRVAAGCAADETSGHWCDCVTANVLLGNELMTLKQGHVAGTHC